MVTTENKNPKTGGFTLIEILVLTALIGILTILLFSILINFLKSQDTAKKMSALQNTSSRIFNNLTREIYRSDRISEVADNELTLIQVQSDETDLEVIFRVESDGRLWKDGRPISPPKVIINSFAITNLEPDKIPCLEIQLALEFANSEPEVTLENKTTISLRKQKLKLFEE